MSSAAQSNVSWSVPVGNAEVDSVTALTSIHSCCMVVAEGIGAPSTTSADASGAISAASAGTPWTSPRFPKLNGRRPSSKSLKVVNCIEKDAAASVCPTEINDAPGVGDEIGLVGWEKAFMRERKRESKWHDLNI